MTIAIHDRKYLTLVIADPTADSRFGIFRAPAVGATIHAAYAATQAAVTADATNRITLQLQDGGAAGAGTDVIGARTGGASVGWAALAFNDISPSSPYKLDGGDYLMLNYDENGTVAPGNITVQIEWSSGA
jgi:hypothetical protein